MKKMVFCFQIVLTWYEIKKSWDWEKLLILQNFLDHYNTDKISRTENLFWMHQNFAFFPVGIREKMKIFG